MKRKPRTIYTNTQKTVMWDRWQKGESLHAIARLFDRTHGSVRRILADAFFRQIVGINFPVTVSRRPFLCRYQFIMQDFGIRLDLPCN